MKTRTPTSTKAAKAAEQLAVLIRAIADGEYGHNHWEHVLNSELANLMFHVSNFRTAQKEFVDL
jgi:hypothetical protein